MQFESNQFHNNIIQLESYGLNVGSYYKSFHF